MISLTSRSDVREIKEMFRMFGNVRCYYHTVKHPRGIQIPDLLCITSLYTLPLLQILTWHLTSYTFKDSQTSLLTLPLLQIKEDFVWDVREFFISHTPFQDVREIKESVRITSLLTFPLEMSWPFVRCYINTSFVTNRRFVCVRCFIEDLLQICQC